MAIEICEEREPPVQTRHLVEIGLGEGFSFGRVRHVYVEPPARRLGVGGALVREIVRTAPAAFGTLRLHTQQAAPFYEHLGFARVSEHKATHTMSLAGRRGA